MKSYTITVSPDDGRGAQTTVKVLTDGSTVTVTDVHLKAGSEGGLSSKRLPAIDLDLLLRAVLPATGRTARSVPASDDATKATKVGPAKTAAANAVPMNDASADAAVTKAGAAKAAPAKATATKAGRETAARSAPKPAKKSVAKAAKKSVAKPAKKSVAKPAKKAAAKPAKKSVAKAAPKSPETTARARAAASGRVYRVMPDDFVNTFGKTTMVDLADVYEVPLHTVQAWVNTARKQGKIPPARPRAKAQSRTETEPPILPPPTSP